MEEPFFVRNGYPALSFMHGWVYDLFDHRRIRSAYAPLRRGLGVASVSRCVKWAQFHLFRVKGWHGAFVAVLAAYGDRAQYWRSVVARVDSVAKQKRFEDSAGTTTTRERFYNVEIFQLQDLNDDISKDNLAENTVHDMYQSMALLVGNRPGAVLAIS